MLILFPLRDTTYLPTLAVAFTFFHKSAYLLSVRAGQEALSIAGVVRGQGQRDGCTANLIAGSERHQPPTDSSKYFGIFEDFFKFSRRF
jgi:hypothetical protein